MADIGKYLQVHALLIIPRFFIASLAAKFKVSSGENTLGQLNLQQSGYFN